MPLSDLSYPSLLASGLKIAHKAAAAVLNVYQSTDLFVEKKKDKTPLTLADKESHRVISRELKTLDPVLPLLSEEGRDIPYEERRLWERFWLVDPLDGTKEFINRNGEFTVNIALIERGKPVLGIVHVPVQQKVYYAASGFGAYRLSDTSLLENDVSFEKIFERSARLPLSRPSPSLRLISSRSHPSDQLRGYRDSLIRHYGPVDTVCAGSSLKLCLVAEGTADIYPRFGPTMEWDIAAGQSIVRESRGSVFSAPGNQLNYNKAGLRNPEFIACRDSLPGNCIDLFFGVGKDNPD